MLCMQIVESGKLLMIVSTENMTFYFYNCFKKAKEYVNTTVFRIRSASQSNVEKPGKNQNSDKNRSSDPTEPNVTKRKQETNNSNAKQQPLDLNQRNQKQPPDNTAMVRIRDPVTSKVRTIYLSDSQIEELAVRHEMEKSKVSSIQVNQSSSQAQQSYQQPPAQLPPPQPLNNSSPTRNMGLLKKGRQPLNLSSSRDLLSNDDPPKQDNPKFVVMDEQEEIYATQDNGDVDKLIERHLSEKKKVDGFQAAETTQNDDEKVQSVDFE